MKLSACDRLAQRPLTGPWYRAISLKHWETRLSSHHTSFVASRFSAASPTAPLFRIMYLAETHQVAIHEVGALLGDPAAPVANPRGSWAILHLDVILGCIVDLTEPAQQRLLGTTEMELTGIWRNSRTATPTQRLGEALH